MSVLLWLAPANSMIRSACGRYSITGARTTHGGLIYMPVYKGVPVSTFLPHCLTADEAKQACQKHSDEAVP